MRNDDSELPEAGSEGSHGLPTNAASNEVQSAPNANRANDHGLETSRSKSIDSDGEVLEGVALDPDRIPDAIAQAVQQISIERSGPLPPPSEMKGYAEILPDAPDRIMKMAEQQTQAFTRASNARAEVALINAQSNASSTKRAQLIGAGSIAAFLALTVLALDKGADIVAIGAGLAAVFMAVRPMITRRDDGSETQSSGQQEDSV